MSQRRSDTELAGQNFQAKMLERLLGATGGMANNPEFARGFGNALQNTNKFGMLADFGRGLADYGGVGSQRNSMLFNERVPESQKQRDMLGLENRKLDESRYGVDRQYDINKLIDSSNTMRTRLTERGATERTGMTTRSGEATARINAQNNIDTTRIQNDATNRQTDWMTKQFAADPERFWEMQDLRKKDPNATAGPPSLNHSPLVEEDISEYLKPRPVVDPNIQSFGAYPGLTRDKRKARSPYLPTAVLGVRN